MATAAALAFVQKLYVAYYQRPADFAGQQFWAEKFDKEGGASAIASAFATSAESVTLYGSQALAAQINAVYQASFGRAAETAGLQFYLNEISQGRMTTGTMAVAVLNGAQGTDLTTLTSKLAVAAAYTTAASDAAGILKYAGTTAADTARTFLAAVTTANQATQTSAVTTNLNSIVAAGSSFTLTAGIDSFTGSAGGDSFSSTLAGGFGLLDNLDGGAGTDILTVSDTTAIATATSQMVKNIETVSLNSSAGVIADMSTWTGLTKATLSGVGVMSATAADSVVASITTSGGNAVTVIGTGGDLAVTTGNTAGATVNIGQTAVANKFTSVSVTGGQAVNITDRSGAAAVTGSTLKTVSVNGAALATTITGDGVTTLNLTNLMGADTLNGVTLNAVAGTRALVLNLSGVDTLGDGKATAVTNTIQDATATSLSINAITAKSFDVTAVAGAATSVAVKADVDLHMDALTAGVATAVSLMGAGKIEVTADTLAAAAVITSTNTGGVTLTQALLAGQQFVGTSSSGVDMITVGAATVAHTLGAGNDIATVTADLGTGGSVDGGAGTDIVRLTSANAALVTTTTSTKAASYTNFETLALTDGFGGAAVAIDVTKLGTAVTTVNIQGAANADNGALTVNTGTVVNLAGSADDAGTFGVTVGGTATTDALTLNMNGWNAAAATFTGIETLNINTGTGVAVTATDTVFGVSASAAELTSITMVPSATASAAIVITGASSLTMGGAITAVNVINASALTGTGALTMAAGTTSNGTGITITGSANADTLIGSAQADAITAGGGADTITGGVGKDTITLTETTSAVDTLKYSESGSATSVDTVTGFKVATDIISIDKGNITGVGTETISNIAGTDIAAAIAANVLTAVSVTNAAAVAGGTNNLIFMSSITGTTFATAIGTGTVTGATDANFTTATEGVLATWYDVTNSQAVVGYILNNSTTVADTISAADGFVEVARIGMVSTDYTSANLVASLSVF